MKRRTLYALAISSLLLMVPLGAAQQDAKLPRIAVVFASSPVGEMTGFPEPEGRSPALRAFFHRLQELGYQEGENLLIERRSAEGHPESYPAIFEELVHSDITLIVATGATAARDALQATRSIPIVIASTGGDPVAAGLVESLVRPGGNLTGFADTVNLGVFDAKRLQLLQKVVPAARRVVILTWPAGRSPIAPVAPELDAAARESGVQLEVVAVDAPEQLADAFNAIDQARPNALFVKGWPLAYAERQRIAKFALQHRLPSIGADIEQAEAGLLMSYGVDNDEAWRVAAELTDKILKGANPGDLPIRQPMRFPLVLNQKTAGALGIEFPHEVRVQAARVIE